MKFNWKLTIIILLTVFLRLYQLGKIPPSLDWDEVSLAYNAKALLETGRDEYGNSWPITIRSFHDYKPALYTYSLIPLFAIFGTDDWVIRLPSALAGIFTVLLTYFLTNELFKNKKLSLLTTFLLAISPWSLQFSRGAFETNSALFFFVAGVWIFIKSIRQSKWLPLSALLLGLSLMAYHSTKIVIPLLLIFIGVPHLKKFWANKKPLVSAILVTSIFLLLIGRTIEQGVGQSRLSSVSFTTIDNLLDNSRHRIESANYSFTSRLLNHRYLVYVKEIIGGYLDHYDLKFWFVEGDSIERHTAVGLGLFHWWTLPFIFIGIIALIKYPGKNTKIIVFSWFLLAPTASALTSGTPNSIRAIFFTPTFEIFIALGILSVLRSKFSLFVIPYSLFALVNIAAYFHLYYVHTPKETSQAWQYGYKQMIEWVMPRKSNWDKIVITNSYDQPYIYTLWYGNYSPKIWTNDGEFANRFDNFEFRSIHWREDIHLKNTLLIGTPNEIKEKNKTIWSVNFLDGSPAFLAVATD